MLDFFTLQIYYNGHFVIEGGPKYLGGLVSWIEMVEPNKTTHVEVVKMGNELGCSSTSLFYFRMPTSILDNRLRFINSNEALLDMFQVHRNENENCINLYVEDIMNLGLIDLIDSFTNENYPNTLPFVHFPHDSEDPSTNLSSFNIVSFQANDANNSDSTHEHDMKSSCEGDLSMNFNFFAERDRLSDTNDLVSNDDTMINVVTYVTDNENDIQSDLDVLCSPNQSDNENASFKFLEFHEESDMISQK
ncbi:hypothetical protein Pfo_020304 [Paulownia fortunei]|nr:hypothetical protein Pfo_020304 [Paulownia fortunei]